MRRAFSLFLLLATAPAAAQTTLPSDAQWHGTPGGPAIGALRRGTGVSTVRTSGEWTLVTVEGWVASFRLESRRDTLDRTVVGAGRAPIRAADGPTQQQLGDVVPGTLLKRLAERNGWTQVRRSAWIRSAALDPPSATPAAAARPPATNTQSERTTTPPGAGTSHRVVRPTSVRANPGGGDERASVRAGAIVETLARDGGWARVRIEGWVPERDLIVADSAADPQLSAADLRATPAAHRGKIVQWEVEVIALQRADPLRRGLTPDEPYLLARGPGDESAILYLALPAALLEQARAISPLASVTVTARVRDGNSPPVGVPILDVISFSRAP
jgi:hypothetical protein